MALSLEWGVRSLQRTAADLSPNNPGFAMVDWRSRLNVRVSGFPAKTAANRQLTILGPPPISRLSLAGCALLARFASNLPENCRISGAPEATSGRGGVLEAPQAINQELPA